MLNKQDIIAQLQAGSTMDEIVDNITKTINDAQDEYRVIQEKEEADAKRIAEEAKEADRVAAAKREAVNMMLDGLCDYLVASGEDEILEELHQIETEKVVEMIDSSLEVTRNLIKLKDVQFAASPFYIFNKWFS